MGDGSFMFSNSSLATAREYDMPVVVLVMNNRSLQIERELMERKYGRSAFVDYKIEKTKELWGPDYTKIAEAMEAEATKISKPEQLMPAFEKAMKSGRSHVLDIDIDLHLEGYRSVWYRYPDDFWTSRQEIGKTF
jgi:acetolactate synthase-1/2/3 large subunit